MDKEDKTKKLKIEIPDNPFDEASDYDDELYEDEEEGFDDEDERLSAEDWDLIKKELEDTKWKPKDVSLETYFRENEEGIKRAFYCYVIGCMNDEQIYSHIDGFQQLMKEEHKLPKEIKNDYVTMDFRKEQIQQQAEQLSNKVMDDLFSLLNANPSTKSS